MEEEEKSDCINVKALEMESTDKFILDRVKEVVSDSNLLKENTKKAVLSEKKRLNQNMLKREIASKKRFKEYKDK